MFSRCEKTFFLRNGGLFLAAILLFVFPLSVSAVDFNGVVEFVGGQINMNGGLINNITSPETEGNSGANLGMLNSRLYGVDFDLSYLGAAIGLCLDYFWGLFNGLNLGNISNRIQSLYTLFDGMQDSIWDLESDTLYWQSGNAYDEKSIPFAENVSRNGVSLVTNSDVRNSTNQIYFNREFSVRRGNVNICGNLSSSYKAFSIEHPQDGDKRLVYAAIEGPENAVYYRGEARLENGKATVRLPDYFEALTREEGRTVLLTSMFDSIDGKIEFLLAALPIKNGAFEVVSTSGVNQSQRFYWEVKAIRSDIALLETERNK